MSTATITTKDADEARRRELAAFLRSRRDRLAPESVGLPAFGRRRAPGLRREEVAQLAGVGVTWYTWLEQGRPINVSGQVLTAIGRALRLDDDETSHLFTLAGLPEVVAPEREIIIGSVRAILDGLDPLPAYVVSARYDILAWNRAAAQLLGDFGKLPKERRNTLWLIHTEPAWEGLIGGHETETGVACVARFRRSFAAHLGEPEWEALLEELLERSPEFRAKWDRYDVTLFAPRVKKLNHPYVGWLRLAATTLWLADQPGTRLVVYNATDDETAEGLRLLQDKEPWVPWTDASR